MQHIPPLLFTYDFEVPVWRIRLDTSTHRLAIEARDADVLMAHFYTLNTLTHHLQPLHLPPGQAWWLGLEDAQDGLVYLHGYGDRKLGQHKGIYAYDTPSLALAWERPDLAFYGMVAQGVLAYTADAPENAFQVLQHTTGAPLQAELSQQEAAEQAAAFSVSRYAHAIYPVLYLEGEEYFAQVQQFLQAQDLQEASLAIEYAETDTAFILSYYTPSAGGTFQNCIAVFDTTGSLRLKDTLADGLTGIGSDTFFIFMDDLYFLKNKATLEVYRI